nr:lipase 3-like [Leptinotarsa decemlineata]
MQSVNLVLIGLLSIVMSRFVSGKSKSHSSGIKHSPSKVRWKSTIDMIEDENYPVENVYVTTPDGYILNIHRIPHAKYGRRNGKVAYLQHGASGSSSDWIYFGPKNALGFILADEGYDVWLGNTRGNTYSRNHTILNPDTDVEFWDYTWHEMGVFDIPSIIDHILEKTGTDGVYYVGHSQGSTVFYVMASMKPEYNKKIKTHISLAPIVYLSHLKSPILRVLAASEKHFSELFRRAGVYELLPNRGDLVAIAKEVCPSIIGNVLCQNILYMLVGFSPKQMNFNRVPLDHMPAGTGMKVFMHFIQEIRSKKFCRYDYGTSGNMKKYGQTSPPNYDLKKITAPVYIIYSENDMLYATEDIEKLFKELPNRQEKLLITDRLWGHLDFLYGKDAPKFVYNEIVMIFGQQ